MDRSSIAESSEYLMAGVLALPLLSFVLQRGDNTVADGTPVEVDSWEKTAD